jgi:hypothetical protein
MSNFQKKLIGLNIMSKIRTCFPKHNLIGLLNYMQSSDPLEILPKMSKWKTKQNLIYFQNINKKILFIISHYILQNIICKFCHCPEMKNMEKID